MRQALAALALVPVFAAGPGAAFTPQTCPMLEEDGRVTVARLYRPQWEYASPTRDYDHAVLGDDVEYRTLRIAGFPASRSMTPPEGVSVTGMTPASAFAVTLPEGRVFEDTAPRPFEWTTDAFHVVSGVPKLGLAVAVVETEIDAGATLAVYEVGCGGIRKLAATDPIGVPKRWLAPAGIADFDNDGRNDIAYVETPHLAGLLRIVTLQDGALIPVAEAVPGFSNHQIGEERILSGVRLCDGVPELVLPDLAWERLMVVRVEAGAVVSRPLDHAASMEGLATALACE